MLKKTLVVLLVVLYPFVGYGAPKAKITYTPLIEAAISGDAASIRSLIKGGADVNETSSNGFSPLMAAAMKGHIDAVRLLLAHGADISLRNKNGVAVLTYAVLSKDNSAKIAKILISRGADVNALSNDGRTPLMSAAIKNVEAVKVLIKNGADVNARSRIKGNSTPLIKAALAGKHDIIKVLLDNGADPHADAAGLLSLTMFMSPYEGMRLLIERGVDVNARGTAGGTVLMDALNVEGDKGLTLMLLQYGADPETKNKSGDTPLIYATRGGHMDILELLLKKKIKNFDAVGYKGNTALIYAARGGHADMVRILLSKGADKNKKNEWGQTALSVAKKSEIIKLLKEAK